MLQLHDVDKFWMFGLYMYSGAALGNGTSLVVSSLPVTELYRDGINRSEDVVDDCCC